MILARIGDTAGHPLCRDRMRSLRGAVRRACVRKKQAVRAQDISVRLATGEEA